MTLPDARQVSWARIGIGAVSIVMPGVATHVAGTPRRDASGSVRLFTALFGVREVAVGVATIAALAGRADHRRVCLANAAVDSADVVVMVRSIGRDGPSRLALGSLPPTLAVVANWLRLASSPK